MNSRSNTILGVDGIDTVDNKHFIWSLLDEEHIFDGIKGENMQSVINIFETVINTVKNSNMSLDKPATTASIAAMNKEVIQRMVIEIPRYKASIAPLEAASLHAPKNQIQMVYKSADLQEARIQDMTSKLKLHEDDMNSFLVLKKPAEINFADDRANDDRPIGDEMEQLIQAALASRARELEILMPPAPAPAPATTQVRQNEPVYSNIKKNVSFSDDGDDDGDDDDETDPVEDKELSKIFNKLKRIEHERQDQEKKGGGGDDEKLGNLLRLLYDMGDTLQGVIRAVKVMQSGE